MRRSGVAKLTIEGESMAVGIRATTIEGACGVTELKVKGEPVAVGMRAATIKGACGVAKLAIEGESMRSTWTPQPSKGPAARWS